MSSQTRGILLAGGSGSRLYPLTAVTNKQLQPIYNKPMVYYPLTTMMLSGVRDMLLISSPPEVPRFRELLGDGSQWGVQIQYAVQPEPRGIAQAIIIADEVGFLGADHQTMLMLGDNLIYGRLDFLRKAVAANRDGAMIFAHQVKDPSAYGVVEFDSQFRALSLEEKPAQPKSPWAVPGMYVYGPGVAARARDLRPSARGELEITDLNRTYLDDGSLIAWPMGRGIAWFDTGTAQELHAAAAFVQSIEERQGLIIGSPEEAAYRSGFLSSEQLARTVAQLPSCPYRSYLERLVDESRG